MWKNTIHTCQAKLAADFLRRVPCWKVAWSKEYKRDSRIGVPFLDKFKNPLSRITSCSSVVHMAWFQPSKTMSSCMVYPSSSFSNQITELPLTFLLLTMPPQTWSPTNRSPISVRGLVSGWQKVLLAWTIISRTLCCDLGDDSVIRCRPSRIGANLQTDPEFLSFLIARISCTVRYRLYIVLGCPSQTPSFCQTLYKKKYNMKFFFFFFSSNGRLGGRIEVGQGWATFSWGPMWWWWHMVGFDPFAARWLMHTRL